MNVCSYSFFRHEASAYESPRCGEAQGRFFVNYLRTLTRAHLAVWPEWELRIYHDDRVREFPYFRVLTELHKEAVINLVPMGEAKTLCGAMLWRILPMFDPAVRYLVCRDVDSLPMPRDRKMVDEFIKSGAVVHAIHDSISHSGPLMGGMVAFDAENFRTRTGHRSIGTLLDAGINLGINWNLHGADQKFLNGVVYPYLAPATFIHTKRDDRPYQAMCTKPVVPQECDQDRLANHVGGAFDVEGAYKYYTSVHQQSEKLQFITDTERACGVTQ